MTPEETQRLAALEQRVAQLESLLHVAPPGPAGNTPPPLSKRPSQRESALEAAFGLTWISRIGVITLVLALAFFFEYAFENHWITEWGRIALGWAAGSVSLFFGERFWRNGQQTFAQALTGAGAAFFYLSFWAAFALYHLLTQPAAFGLMLLTAAAAGKLALRYNSAAVAGMALVSGYATPFLLGNQAHPWPVLAYLLLVAVSGVAVAARRGWSSAAGIAFLGFWAAYSAWSSPGRPFASIFLALTAAFLLFLAWPVWRSRDRGQALRLPDLAILALGAAFYFGFCYFLLEPKYRPWEGAFAVGVAAAEAGAAWLLWGRDSRGSTLAAATAWTLLVLAVPIQLAGYRITIGWSLEAAAIAWIGMRLRDTRAVFASAAVFVLVLGRLAVLDSRMYTNPSAYAELFNARFLAFAVSAAALWSVAWWGTQAKTKSLRGYPVAAYVAGHTVFLWGLCLEATDWAVRSTAPQNARSVSSTAISVLIAAYAVILVAAGVFRRNAATRLVGVALIGLVILKLYLYDVWFLGEFYRMAAFAILGVLLLMMSYFYSRFRNSSRKRLGQASSPNAL